MTLLSSRIATLVYPPIVLPYDSSTGRVISGTWTGSDVDALAEAMIRSHLRAGRQVVARHTTLSPWWRFWRPTRTIRITVRS